MCCDLNAQTNKSLATA